MVYSYRHEGAVYMNESKNKVIQLFDSYIFCIVVFLASLAGVIFILLSTSPLALGPQGMLVAYSSFYLLFFTMIILCIKLWRTFRIKFSTSKQSETNFLNTSYVMLAALFALGLLILLALQSIGQLDILSAFLVVLFVTIACFYLVRRSH
jgi:hypothetical protein